MTNEGDKTRGRFCILDPQVPSKSEWIFLKNSMRPKKKEKTFYDGLCIFMTPHDACLSNLNNCGATSSDLRALFNTPC